MIIVFLLFLAGLATFIVQVAIHIHTIRSGKTSHRNNSFRERFVWALKATLGQTRIVERPWGWAHVVLMWAFFVFLTSGLEMLISCILPEFTWTKLIGIHGRSALCVIQTWFAWAAIFAVIFVGGRRIRNKKLYTNFDAIFVLTDIFLLMITHIVAMSASIPINHTAGWANFLMPAEYGLSTLLQENASDIHTIASGIHLVLMSLFLIWIPHSKHLHILMAWPDVFLAYRDWYKEPQTIPATPGISGPTYDRVAARIDAINSDARSPYGQRPKATQSIAKPRLAPERIDFDDYEAKCCAAIDMGQEEMPTIGIRHFCDTTTKQRLEAFSCTRCMRCTMACPMVKAKVTESGPMDAMISLRRMCANPRRHDKKLLVPSLMSQEDLWNCTMCGACDRACPLSHEHTLRILMMRQNAIAQQTDVPDKLDKVFASVERSGNPWGYPAKDRRNFFKVEKRKTARVVIFAGCMAAYDKTAAETLNNVVRWMRHQEYEVIMLPGETCCGEPLRKAGNELGFEAQATENVKKLKATRASLILTTCPHCAATLSDAYKDYGLEIPAMHFMQFLARLNQNNQLAFNPTEHDKSIALHMPCNLSKQNDTTPQIVKLLTDAGLNVMQTEDSRTASCCGAGGAKFFFSEDRSIAQMRFQELMALNASNIGTLCPFCTQMLTDSVQKSNANTLSPCVNVIDLVISCASLVRDDTPTRS